MGSNTGIHYYIARDLNWYIRKTGVSPYSEVRLYTTSQSAGYRYRTPYVNGESDIRIVGFPALNRFCSGQELSGLPRRDGGTGNYSINNVQLRVSSFVSGSDAAFGLICSNEGTINNIYTNNLNLVLASGVSDGATSDYGRISCGSTDITQDGYTLADKPVGGFIGINTGTVGVTGSTGVDGNTICMSNTIVMAGQYWQIGGTYKQATGGIIGRNTGTVNGMLELNGTFAIIGRDKVGGVIGHSSSNVSAVLVVNGGAGQGIPASEFTLPSNTNAGNGGMSCVIAARNSVGAAIGLIENSSLNYAVDNQFSSSEVSTNADTGSLTFATRNAHTNFNIDVSLPTNSLILQLARFDGEGSGGAIGKISGCSGNLSIRVRNDGRIVTDKPSSGIYSVYVGGAIGFESSCSIQNLYIDIENGSNSRIGYIENTWGPRSAGGAIGYIDSTSTSRTIAINAVNGGTIIARAGNECTGVGGAIGALGKKVKAAFYINVVNSTGSNIISTSTNGVDKLDATGGAIGAMWYESNSKPSEISSGSVIYAENHGSIAGNYHVGGTIGNSAGCYGKIYAVNVGANISGVDFVGGAIGSEYDSQNGYVQSILKDGTYIHGTSFIGGTAGSIQSFYDCASITTIVQGTPSTVEGSGSLIGGVCGDLKVYYDTHAGTLTLRGDSSDTAALNVVGGSSSDYVGGAVGLMRSREGNYGNINWHMSMPDQSANNKLIVNVDGRSYVGGAVGQMGCLSVNITYYLSSITSAASKASDILLDLNVVLRPESHIIGTGSDVGGAIGRVVTSSGCRYQGRIA